MGAFEEAKEWLVESVGMWWPDGDEHKLRQAADAWRTYADAVDDVRAASNRKAAALIHNNKGEAIEAFDAFWHRYQHGDKGWLQDLEGSARDMADGCDKLADAIADAKDTIDTQLWISAAAIAAGIALTALTGGLAAGAAVTATTLMIDTAAAAGVALSTTAARIGAGVLVGAFFGGVESVSLNLAVVQPLQMGTGLQKDGFRFDLANQALVL
ncbi:WXG100-like domain-containing protein [Streptomyces sp. H27-D2]|uniref:WXG100-like domain-containing protein n=1 Tax=Streptomyces sp. H27-D2 TaxID=3046304 RepID=UPI002DBB012E|nr:hypothetical protein [Streptomyces sp. H27-D2]MEC4016983.1 hypothetical protein [Streptomyces sp. H27-D2]